MQKRKRKVQIRIIERVVMVIVDGQLEERQIVEAVRV